MNRKPFPETLEGLLAERDWSRRELSRRTRDELPPGIGHVSINLLMRGELPPSIRVMEMIAKVTRVQPETFAEYRLEKAREALNWRKRGLTRALKALDE